MIDPYTGLGWFDDEPERRKPTARKIAEAAYRYNAKFPDRVATSVLVNEADAGTVVAGLVITASRRIRPHNFWVLGELRSRVDADQARS